MITNTTLPEHFTSIKALLRRTKKVRIAETKHLDRSYITITSLPELTSKVPYYTVDGEKVKVHAGVLNITCNRKLKWHITHQQGRFMTSSDPTMHKTVQDILSDLLETVGYTVEQEYSLSFEFPEFILVNEFDLFAHRGDE